MKCPSGPRSSFLFFLACTILTGCTTAGNEEKREKEKEAEETASTVEPLRLDIPIEEPAASWRELEKEIDTMRSSQRDLNLMSYVEQLKQQEEMNAVLRNIWQEYAGDTVFLAALGEAQRAWTQYREAHLKARFPVRDGSASPMCRAAVKEDLIRTRIGELRMWLTEPDDGDIGNGSYRFRPPENGNAE